MIMILKRKKLTFYSCMILLLICFCFSISTLIFNDNKTNETVSDNINTSDELPAGDVIAVSTEDDYFFKTKAEKEISRSRTVEILTNIIDDLYSSQEAKKEAELKLMDIANNSEKEFKIESILRAKGFNENTVFISDGLTSIAIKTNELSQEDVAKINDIASEITGNNNIKIVEVE